VDVVVGAPAGKTKTILVDLAGHLPEGAVKLRLSQAFEIHWDRIALFRASAPARPAEARPERADLHWRGYADFAPLPDTEPLTPVYAPVHSRPPWRITPSGWATRYGRVDELLRAEDDALVVVAAGDELTLEFDPALTPPLPGHERRWFLWTTGWDKDADYHVAAGDAIAPLPWHAMDDQRHGVEPRPPGPSDALHERYNTRWVGPLNYRRAEARGK
jgi:hypothetical protein